MAMNNNWHLAASFRRDSSVIDKKLPPGTVRRIVRFAAPYKRELVVVPAPVVLDAVIGALNPLIFRAIIDKGIGEHERRAHRVLAGHRRVAGGHRRRGLAGERWFSARIGEGLIYDMRSKVFEHVQRMPIAFFTRTQTGALISRLNNDVLGAQQAFTGTLSNVVSNLISVTLVLAAMFFLSWQITLIALILLPLFVIPARADVGRGCSGSPARATCSTPR